MSDDQGHVTEDKGHLHSFIYEFSIVAGAGVGGVIAAQRLINGFKPVHDNLITQFAASPWAGYLVFGAMAIGIPVLANVMTGKEWNERYTPAEEHERSRINGICGGALFTLAVAFNNLALPPLIENHNDQIVQFAQTAAQSFASLGFTGA